MNQILLQASQISYLVKRKLILDCCSCLVPAASITVICGPSGAGKTTLAKILAGLLAPASGSLFLPGTDQIYPVYVPQQHDFRFAVRTTSYFGQRFDRDYENDFPTVAAVLSACNAPAEVYKKIIRLLHLEAKLGQPIIELSNGEGKRVQIAMTLLAEPASVIFDQPFIGLDVATRLIVCQLFERLRQEGKTVILVLSDPELSFAVDHWVMLEKGRIVTEGDSLPTADPLMAAKVKPLVAVSPPSKFSPPNFSEAIRMNNVCVQYGGKMILDQVSWVVKAGEHWALTGPNGSGKSTLLSLVNADNPQAYVNDITLFDRKRGTGESIWDIRKKIGFVSPELHHYFQPNVSYIETISVAAGDDSMGGFSSDNGTCFQAVGSGLLDQVGSSSKLSDLQKKQVVACMHTLGIEQLALKPFSICATGEQRLVLLARALVKNPPLLILDEPCQCLDKDQSLHFLQIVDRIGRYTSTTIIYVSHYEAEMPGCINRRLVLENGKVIKNQCCQ